MVAPSVVAAGIQAGGNLLSSFFNKGSSGTKIPSMEDQLSYSRSHQQLLAKSLPSYMVEGAKKAGLHPLAVVGMQPAGGATSVQFQGKQPKSNKLHEMGQNIARAAGAYQSIQERAFTKKMQDQQLRRAQLENELLEGQITTVHKNNNPSFGTGSAYTVDGQGNSKADNAVKVEPHRVTSKAGSDKGLAAGKPPAFVKYDLGNGQTIELPFSEEGPSESIENLPVGIKHLKAAEMYYKRHYKNTPGYWMAKKLKKFKNRKRK